jgi:uncharacterized membrane protein
MLIAAFICFAIAALLIGAVVGMVALPFLISWICTR